jgi:dTDP-4-amino-4,6-dideoxygalactose transaminase
VLALKALGIGPDHTVVLPTFTAVATAVAVQIVGATPLLLDIDPRFYTLDPDELARVLDRLPPDLPPIRAVIAVHLYGQPCDMPAIADMCRWRGAALIEDCAQAHGATLNGQNVGTFGDAAAWSFYPTKNLGALGDAGAVTTNNRRIADAVRALRQYGWDNDRRTRISGGINSRMDEIQAAILLANLADIDLRDNRRFEISSAYREALRPELHPALRPDSEHALHLFVLRASPWMRVAMRRPYQTHPDRSDLIRHFAEAGIGTAIHYARPIHYEPAFIRSARGPSRCTNAERAADEVLSIPLWPEMTDAEVATVCEALEKL